MAILRREQYECRKAVKNRTRALPTSTSSSNTILISNTISTFNKHLLQQQSLLPYTDGLHPQVVYRPEGRNTFPQKRSVPQQASTWSLMPVLWAESCAAPLLRALVLAGAFAATVLVNNDRSDNNGATGVTNSKSIYQVPWCRKEALPDLQPVKRSASGETAERPWTILPSSTGSQSSSGDNTANPFTPDLTLRPRQNIEAVIDAPKCGNCKKLPRAPFKVKLPLGQEIAGVSAAAEGNMTFPRLAEEVECLEVDEDATVPCNAANNADEAANTFENGSVCHQDLGTVHAKDRSSGSHRSKSLVIKFAKVIKVVICSAVNVICIIGTFQFAGCDKGAGDRDRDRGRDRDLRPTTPPPVASNSYVPGRSSRCNSTRSSITTNDYTTISNSIHNSGSEDNAHSSKIPADTNTCKANNTFPAISVPKKMRNIESSKS
ncbi:hypothetical protein F5883DRAFT_513871 [Diaporthe sp. PMI_573]|nr:hypothetical protein F5883DRAFT_513871 [Diaporthaceae sp. PMI_573]